MNGLDKLWNAWREELSTLDQEMKTRREKYTGMGITERGVLYLISDHRRIFRPLDPDLLRAVQSGEGDDALYQTAAKALHAYPMKASAEIFAGQFDPNAPAVWNLARGYHILGLYPNDRTIQVHFDVVTTEVKAYRDTFLDKIMDARTVELFLRVLRGEEKDIREEAKKYLTNREQAIVDAKAMLADSPEIAQYIEDVDPSLKDVLRTPCVNEMHIVFNENGDAEVQRI